MDSVHRSRPPDVAQDLGSTDLESHYMFRHEPLDMAKSQIRLLTLYPSSSACSERGSTPIHYDLEVFDLDEVPDYVALSYVWGPPDPKELIFADHRGYEVGENLFHFLRNFRDSTQNHRYLWIDQLCIDQDNTLEKNHQVRMMSQIYKRSCFALVWLGERFAVRQTIESDKGLLFDGLNFLESEYFTRLWIVQEMLLPPEVKFLYDRRCIEWLRVRSSVFNWPNDEHPSQIALFNGRERGVRYGHLRHQRFEWILKMFSGGSCENLRDKVYGLLGLFEFSDIIEVDYNKSVGEVFIDTVSRLADNAWDIEKDWSPRRNELTRLYVELARDMLPHYHWYEHVREFLQQYLDAGYKSFREHRRSSMIELSFHESFHEQGAELRYEIESQDRHYSEFIRRDRSDK